MQKSLITYLSLIALLIFGCQKASTEFKSTADYVDPFIGTGAHGHTFPGATTPFGMVQLSPDNGTEGWDWVAGYHYSDSVIAGFSHTHLSGTGIGDWADILVSPVQTKDIERALASDLFQQAFSHENETAVPGYYQVRFNSGLKAQLTATPRVGIHHYSHEDASENINLIVDLGFAINWDETTDALIKWLNDSTLVGYRHSTGWSKNQQQYFAAQFNHSIANLQLLDSESSISTSEKEIQSNKAKALVQFNSNQLLVKVGLSSASIEGALKAIEVESQSNDFDYYKDQAKQLWQKELGSIQASFAYPYQDTIFATALYHSSIAPNLYSDSEGGYKAVGGGVKQTENFDRYTVFSLWDTFRAANPLFLFTQNERLDDFFRSMLSFYDESGLLPVWALSGHETNTMTGYHAVPVLAEAILKGRLQDAALVSQAYEAMKKSAMQDIRGTNYYREYGYIPADKDGWSVTKTLEYAYDDWCIAQVANYLGKKDDANYFQKRAQSYRALFDPETEFMRAKDSEGNWVEPFDPYYSEHGFEGMYIEGTAWQHSWFVPHDILGLIDLFGSEEAMIAKLDATFEASSELRGENISVDISGLIGQYAHGNEPSHHVAYMYAMAGQAWKTQEKVRQIMDELYTTGPEGLSGNDDCGQMSAWYIFSAMGFYPVDPVSGKYIIGSPLVKEAQMNLPNGKTFSIIAENQSEKNIYVQKIELNGQLLERSWITFEEIMQGGQIKFSMSSSPVLERF